MTDVARGFRILIVEDEALIAEELRDRLTRAALTVVGSTDTAEEAIRLADKMRPDVVLMDIRLNGKRDGIEAADEIRRRVDVPIVYLTAHSDRATLERAKHTAPFGYLVKPFEERELLVAIELAVHRHSLERRLRESERKFAATLASIGDAVIATDIRQRVTFMNPVAEALTTWTAGEARGLPADQVFRVVRDESGAGSINPVGEVLEQGRAVRLEREGVSLIARNQDAIPIDYCAAPIVDEHKRVAGVVVAFRDIRDRRLEEDALRRAQEELVQSHKMEAIGRLAGGMAHDFNNLLMVINGCTELVLSREGLDEATATLLRRVEKAGSEAASLTRQILAFARKQVLRPEVLDLNDVVTRSTALFGPLLGASIEVTTSLNPVPTLAFADAAQLEQVILQLAVNARDAMLPEGGTLTLATGRAVVYDEAPDEKPPEGQPGQYVTVMVSDTGRGMNETVRSQIFEPFFSTKDAGIGAGLGLAAVYGTIKQSRGFIRVDSEPGRGATFTIYLPVVAEPAVRVPARADRPAVPTKETILLVDDEDHVRSMLATTLRRRGYFVVEAGDGADALRAVSDHTGPIHLVITDVMMPRMKGPELVARLKALQYDGPVLYISGHTDDPAPRAPNVAFMGKPFSPSTFVKKVRDLLDG